MKEEWRSLDWCDTHQFSNTGKVRRLVDREYKIMRQSLSGGYPTDQDLTPKTLTGLKNCRMAIYWGTNKGLQQLCETGPTDSSKISAPADIPVLHDITAVFDVTDKAAEAWMQRK